MPRFKGDPPGPSSVIHMNVRDSVMDTVREAQKQGYWAETSQGAFLGYLIYLGIKAYMQQVLPAEKGGAVTEQATGPGETSLGPTPTEGQPHKEAM